MKCLLVLASLILTASLVGQVEHAPTVAQCQADQRLWLSKLLVDEKVKRDDRLCCRRPEQSGGLRTYREPSYRRYNYFVMTKEQLQITQNLKLVERDIELFQNDPQRDQDYFDALLALRGKLQRELKRLDN
jgi:hypothetical protein